MDSWGFAWIRGRLQEGRQKHDSKNNKDSHDFAKVRTKERDLKPACSDPFIILKGKYGAAVDWGTGGKEGVSRILCVMANLFANPAGVSFHGSCHCALDFARRRLNHPSSASARTKNWCTAYRDG